MKQLFSKRSLAAIAASVALCATATDYYVANGGNDSADGSEETPFETIDKAASTAVAGDTIYVKEGDYTTNVGYGPELKANLVGLGSTPDDVVISSTVGRALKIVSGTVTNITFVGGYTENSNGGTLYMTGGTLVDCVVKDGVAKEYGGNIFITGGVITDCVITNGTATKSGGNVLMKETAQLLNTSLGGGSTLNNEGGNVRIEGGVASNIFAVCNGSVAGSGGCVWMNNGVLKDSVLKGGTGVGYYGGTLYMDGGVATNLVCDSGVSQRRGGNVYINKGTLLDSTIRNGICTGTGEKRGANVLLNAGSIIRCKISGGSCESYNAGSVATISNSAVIDNCLIERSECGGIFFDSAASVYNTTVINNGKYGVWAWTNARTVRVYNSVFYGNLNDDNNNADWSGELPVLTSGAIFLNCASASDSRLKTDTFETLVEVGSSDFVDYSNDDYRPVAGGALFNAGVADPRGDAASATDLNGDPRIMKQIIDIGCYEYQPTDFAVDIMIASGNGHYAPAAITFSLIAKNVPENGTVNFTVDFGDGCSTNCTETSVAHTYANVGKYGVSIRGVCEDKSDFTPTAADFVVVSSENVFVKSGNASAAFPYDTESNAYASIQDALADAVDGTIINVLPGTYEAKDQMTVKKAVRIIGRGASATDVVIKNVTEAKVDKQYCRVFELDNEGVSVEGLVIENGQVYNGFGANVRVVSGLVSNCVIRTGLATANGGNGAGGGIEIAGSGIVMNCKVINNVVSGTAKEDAYAGGAVFFPYGSQGKMYNTLVAYNSYIPSSTDKRGAAGIRFGGGNEQVVVENCSIVSNVVDGTISSASAGAFCNSWTTKVRNCVFAANYEVGSNKVSSVNFESHMSVVGCAMDDVAFNQYCIQGTVNEFFRNFGKGDFSPKPKGLLYNAGYDPLVDMVVDVNGKPRVMFGKIDIGCYECQNRPGFVAVIR